MKFETSIRYVDRKTKAAYVADKYGELLKGRILDVGGDDGHIRSYLPEGTQYVGVDLVGRPGVLEVNLEQQPIPDDDASFDTVMCLDVLEHLENLHAVFVELARVTRRWLIVALPNPYSDFYQHLVAVGHAEGGALQHYGVPPEPPNDRHKWFYAGSQAREVLQGWASQVGLETVQFDTEQPEPMRRLPRSMDDVARWKTRILERLLFPRGTFWDDLHHGTHWWVFRKSHAPSIGTRDAGECHR